MARFIETLKLYATPFDAFCAQEEADAAIVLTHGQIGAFWIASNLSRSTGWTPESLTGPDGTLADMSSQIETAILGADTKLSEASESRAARVKLWRVRKSQLKRVLSGAIGCETFRARVVALANGGALDVSLAKLATEADAALGKVKDKPSPVELAIKAIIRCEFSATVEAEILAAVREAAGIEV